MNNHIVTEPCRVIRGIARQALKNNWAAMFLGMIIFYVFTIGVSGLLDLLFNYKTTVLVNGTDVEATVGIGSFVYKLLLTGAFEFGLATFMLTFLRMRKIQYGLIFEGFGCFGKAFALNLLMAIKVFLWTLLFFIPGFIAVFRFSQAYYVMVDHPEFTANQCLHESSRIMRGNKWKLFKLDLSFIGWGFLASIPAGIAEAIELQTGSFSDVVGWILFFVLEIPMCLVYIYMDTANVAFYDILIEKLVPIGSQDSQSM